MIRLFLIKFWPALIPFVIFFFWWLLTKKKNKKLEKEGKQADSAVHAKNMSQATYYMVVSTVFIILLCFGYMTYSVDTNTKAYVPTKVQDGKLVPSYEVDK